MSEPNPNNPPADPPKDPPAIDPAQFAALQEAVAKLEEKNAALIDEKQKANEAARKAAEDAAKKSGDIEALEASWKEQVEKAKAEAATTAQQYQGMIHALTAGAAATKLAAELAISGCADVLLPHIQSRLSVEMKDGKPAVRVLDKDGKPSAATLDDLKREFAESPSFAPIIVGSRAGGAGGSSGGSGGRPVKKFGEYTAAELSAIRKENPQEYERLRKDHYAT